MCKYIFCVECVCSCSYDIYRVLYVKVSFTRGGYKYSLILACESKGVIAYNVHYGAINEELYNEFINFSHEEMVYLTKYLYSKHKHLA